MIRTERLLLRNWRDSDRDPYAVLNADPEVMRYFPRPFSRAESDEAIDRRMRQIATEGHGNWAVERLSDGAFLGHVGVKPTGDDIPLGGAPEVGWRLARHAWGQGYAAEGALAVLDYAFATFDWPTVLAFTSHVNARSEAVMRRIGMRRREELDFEHHEYGADLVLRPQVVYSLDRCQ